MKKILNIIIIFTFIFLIGCTSTIDSKNRKLTNEQWLEDITYLDNEIKSDHPVPFMYISEENWNQNIKSLKKDIPNLSDKEISMRIAQVVSSLQDLHTRLDYLSLLTPIGEETIAADYINSYPIKFEWFENDLRVSMCEENNKEILGAKLISINGIDTNKVLEKVYTLCFSDNSQTDKLSASNIITCYEFLRFLNIVDSEKTTFMLELPNSKQLTLELSPKYIKDTQFITLKDTVNFNPITHQKPDNFSDFYWFNLDKENDILYFRYNKCLSENGPVPSYMQDSSKFPNFIDFSEELINVINTNDFNKFVVDLRYNSGGMDDLTKFLTSAIEGRTNLNEKSKTYVLTGKGTLSAAVFSTIHFKNNLNAIVIGEETGGNVNIPSPTSSSTLYHLPNSNIELLMSMKYTELIPGYKGGFKPDVEVYQTYESYIKGLDDCYEYVKGI